MLEMKVAPCRRKPAEDAKKPPIFTRSAALGVLSVDLYVQLPYNIRIFDLTEVHYDTENI